MKTTWCHRSFVLVLALLAGAWPQTVLACAACFGRSDSPMAKGMNMGIMTLLVVVLSVLVGIAVFFAYILRRAARLAAATPAPSSQPLSEPTP